ncbi:hypothetical protein BJ741DRAFT_121405 [Chytriomyces cf. hyalinus JEL632]|nr:hypothetical protein BJ741DRAFT_121405 [Chytriomyces cf. hyalinus JEL632]
MQTCSGRTGTTENKYSQIQTNIYEAYRKFLASGRRMDCVRNCALSVSLKDVGKQRLLCFCSFGRVDYRADFNNRFLRAAGETNLMECCMTCFSVSSFHTRSSEISSSLRRHWISPFISLIEDTAKIRFNQLDFERIAGCLQISGSSRLLILLIMTSQNSRFKLIMPYCDIYTSRAYTAAAAAAAAETVCAQGKRAATERKLGKASD